MTQVLNFPPSFELAEGEESVSFELLRQLLNMSEEERIAYRNSQMINLLRDQIYAGNVKAGWWTDLSTGEPKPKGNVTEILAKMMLMVSEIGEACEGARKNLMDDHLPHRPMIEVEFADAIIRILDTCGHEGLDIGGAIVDKLAYNAQRADHKVENRLAEGGKKA